MKKDDTEFLVASLTKETPQVAINIYISLLDQATLLVKGDGVVHVVGLCES